jgi:hypothetical protein
MAVTVLSKTAVAKPKSNPRAAIVKALPQGLRRPTRSALDADISKFRLFWDLMDVIQMHGYLRSAMSVVGRSTVGAWWTIKQHDELGRKGSDLQRRKLYAFYSSPVRDWKNIRDFQSFSQKLMIGAMYLKYFGQCAYHILRDANGNPVGLDFLAGFVMPNVDENGRFNSPAFIQYPTRRIYTGVHFDDPRDIVYVTNPDWGGHVSGGSDLESLTEFTLPIDLYLQEAAREYMKNRDKPEAFYILPADISDDAFTDFCNALEAKYKGPRNLGRNPITVAGELDIKELSPLPEGLPYQTSRFDARDEMLAAAGVSGAKVGLSDKLSSGNLRELRKEFHETSMIPLFKLIEDAFYDQIHVREFNFPAWIFSFNNPDFLTAVERATVHMRYHDMSVLNPNEIRQEIGYQPRKDEFGDKYVDEIEGAKKADNQQGNPPEGRMDRPDAPSQTGEPTNDNQDPPRGDQHDETRNERLLSALREYRRFCIRRINDGKTIREFETPDIPDYMLEAIHARLKRCKTATGVKRIFSEVYSLLGEIEEQS